MSFFNEVLGSIGTGQSPAPPKPAQKPLPANLTKPAADATRLVSRPAVSSPISTNNGTKRKAEGDLSGPPDKTIKSNSRPGSSGNANSSLPSSSLSTSDGNPNGKRPMPTPGGPKTQARPPKVPPKGSYADIMARARLAQEQKGQNQVGMIMHQAASKEKVSKMATKRREEDEKANHSKGKTTKHGIDNGKTGKRSTSPAKKPNEARTIKPPRPPPTITASSYKGTMGQPARRRPLSPKSRAKDGRRSSRYDEYLGTDEEDEVDDDEVEDEGGGSDASSNMEAGAFDIDEEERLALKKAKEDDANELALENKLKREKEERRKKLQALADKRR
jgi:hypothetical protein